MAGVILPSGGQEYVHWTATDMPANPAAGSVQASIDKGLTWHDVVISGADLSLLVAHPTATGIDPSAVTASVGIREMLVKLTDSSETVIRSGGWLIVKA